DTAQVKYVNVAKVFASALTFRDNSATGPNLASNVSYTADGGYLDIPATGHQIFVISNGGYVANIGGHQEPPAVATPDTGQATIGLSVDKGLEYSISVTTDNRAGVNDVFYTAAHFHRGSPGVAGPIVRPIDVSSQAVTFPDVSLKGVNAVPPDSTTGASGTGSFKLYANAARDTFELDYTINVTADPNDTTALSSFVAAHFHVGAPGTAGPVVKTIATGVFRDTTIEDEWTTGDTEPLTRALVDSLLKGRIYANFHTPRAGAGEIRAQLVPDTISTNTFTGSWADIPDSMKDSVIAGRLYVNFHTVTNPAGKIRGQVVVDPAKGHYGVGSLPTANPADTTFTAGRLYSVVAYSDGTKLRVLKVSNRQVGLTKPLGDSELNRSSATIPVKR
ncbi:MAG: CHRD domain-containing protein, partial [Ignavibacteriales bacterium]|nr:CHRD domain-containing protein [Ignavibacteriales bacterium]